MSTITFNSIKPKIDKVVYTIRHLNHNSYEYMLKLFNEHFGNGLPKKVGNQFGLIYEEPHIWVSRTLKFNWSRIEFYPNVVNVDKITNILLKFPKNEYFKPYKLDNCQNLRSLEVAFDLKLPDDWNNNHEEIAELISNNLRCEIQKRGFCRTYFGDENKKTSDGAINGINSHYIVSAKNRTLLTLLQPEINRNGCSSITYCKCLPPEGEIMGDKLYYDEEDYRWNIRFEVRLNSRKIKDDTKDLDFVLPYDLKSIFNYYENKKFKDYYSFVDVDFEKFLEKANDKVDSDCELSYRRLSKLAKDKSVSCKIYHMKSIAKLICSKYLYNHINDFINPLSFKTFKKGLYKSIDSLLNNLK